MNPNVFSGPQLALAIGIGIGIGVATQTLAWGFAAGVLSLLVIRILDDRAVMTWANRVLKPPAKVSRYWAPTIQRLTASLHGNRQRTKRLLAALHQIRKTSDELPDAWVVIKQPQGEIEAINRAAEMLLGLSRRDTGTTLSSLIRNPQLDAILHPNELGNLAEIPSPVNDNQRLEVRTIHLEGDTSIVVVRDVTDLNRLLTMRQDFIANVSHELRTPLTVLMGYIEAIDEHDLDEKTIRELASRLVSPVDRMRRMVDDLLMLTKLESATLPDVAAIRSINGAFQLASIIEEASQLTGDQDRLELEADETLEVEGVPEEVRSAFTNLISNAIRYSAAGAQIKVRWHLHHGKARFECADKGVGIAPAHLTRLTERFYRVDMNGSRSRGGTGLGLAIVKHVLRRHQSTLQVESRLGEGSRFYFDLPLQLQQ